MRRIEQRTDPSLKGLRWSLLKHRAHLSEESRADLDALIAKMTTKRTARAWLYREQLREILERKQINVVSAMLKQWCTNVMRSKVEPMKDVARLVRQPSRRHRRLGPDTTDQRLPGGPQRPLPGRQTPSSRLYPLRHHPHRDLPDRRKARLPELNPMRLTHSKFNRAKKEAIPSWETPPPS